MPRAAVSEGNRVTLSQAIQTSAEINPGNSGVDPEFGDAQAPGIGVAIPSSMVQRVANQLIDRGRT
jgi:S1-C subfamily serine protease